MRFAKLLRLLLVPALIFTLLAPLVVSAASGPDTDIGLSAAEGLYDSQQEDDPDSDVGLAVGVGIVALVLILVAIVGVIAAAALGIIGLGYWQSTAE